MAVRFLLFVILFPAAVFSQSDSSKAIFSRQRDTIVLSGVVMDAKSKELLPFCQIEVYDNQELIKTVIGDIDGNFSLKFPFFKDSFVIHILYFQFPEKVFLFKSDTISFKTYSFYLGIVEYDKQRLSEIYEDANKHIQKDKTIILTDDSGLSSSKISRKYGFRYRYIYVPLVGNDRYTSIRDPYMLAYIKAYNEYSNAYLEIRNGKGWFEKFEQEYKDYIYNKLHPKNDYWEKHN